MAISLVGLGIHCHVAGHVPRGTSGRNTRKQVAETLNTTGLYSITRNQLYWGNYFIMLAAMMFPRTVWLPVVATLAFVVYYGLSVAAEEAFLRTKFGSEYEEYLRRVPVFLPRFSLWRPPSLPFSWRTVLKREHSTFFLVVSLYTLLDVGQNFFVKRHFQVDPVWSVLFAVSFVAYVVLRTLKKKTKLLDVPGR